MAFYGDNDAGADGVLAQVASTVDLSAVVIEFVATGN